MKSLLQNKTMADKRGLRQSQGKLPRAEVSPSLTNMSTSILLFT